MEFLKENYLIIILFLWGIPSTFFRNNFRKIIYKTNDLKINIKPVFLKELKGLFFNIYPDNSLYIKQRNLYRFYLFVYLILFIIYLMK